MSDLFNSDEVKFDDLVGDGKKFRDPDAIAKKVVHADRHIDNLEKELSDLRTELQTRITVEDALAKFDQRTEDNPSRIVENLRQENDEGNKPNLSDEVKRLIQAERENDRRQANVERTRAGLKERFGSDYNQKLQSIATDLGVSEKFLSDMGGQSPEAFLKLVDSVAKPDKEIVTPPRGNANFVNSQDHQIMNAAYFSDLRKKDPRAYFSKKVQNLMHKQVFELGEDFYK